MDYTDNRHTRRTSSPEFAYNEKHESHKPSVCYQPRDINGITTAGNAFARSRRVRVFRQGEPGRYHAHFRMQQVRPSVCARRSQAYDGTTDTSAWRTKRTLRQGGTTWQRSLSRRGQQRTRHRIDNQWRKDVRGRHRDRMRHAKTPTRLCQSKIRAQPDTKETTGTYD